MSTQSDAFITVINIFAMQQNIDQYRQLIQRFKKMNERLDVTPTAFSHMGTHIRGRVLTSLRNDRLRLRRDRSFMAFVRARGYSVPELRVKLHTQEVVLREIHTTMAEQHRQKGQVKYWVIDGAERIGPFPRQSFAYAKAEEIYGHQFTS